MARRIVIAFIVALALALSVVYVTWRKISTNNRPVVQPPIQYVTAAHLMDPGETLRAEDLTLVKWPRSNPLNGAFVRVQDVVGRSLLYPVVPGQPILDQQLAAVGSGIGLTGEIPQGMRAVALRSDEVVGVAGFLMPGTHVDVLVTYHQSNDSTPITATVLQDVEVLAVGHQTEPDPSGKPVNVDVVTLLLSPENAEKAVLAAAQGNIHFVLRNGRDDESAKAKPVDVDELAGPPARPRLARVRRPKLPPPPKPWVVETWMGNKLTTESFH
ncbi:MAG TPA: Flp pilus assembly protein CpaB [Acidobacteriaceae bacterium]|nr:Flp pilus assembly protein CpaB [Acidobacteriaceae bacterium]